ncbi:MAG: dihydroorotate dehydrogenase electron transfer subunit [Sedimentisphaerales bacterium]
MTNGPSKPNKGMFDAVVSSNKQIRQRFYRLVLEFSGAGAETFARTKPGQFAQLDLSKASVPTVEEIPEDLQDAAGRKILLRRPFSFCDVSREKEKTRVDVLYGVVGPASLRMAALAKGDSVSVIGPLGNGFSMPADKKIALLIVGGMGAGPLLHLAKTLTADYPKVEVIAFAGAKAKEELPFEKPLDEISQQVGFSLHEFARLGIESMLATDDGSAGYEGLVTDCFLKWLGQRSISIKDTIIYSCGPEKMLSRMARLAEDKKIDCQISMERMMACGIGVCQSCAVKCKVEGSNETTYKLCCEDGPVFDAREVVFSIKKTVMEQKI